MKRLLYVVTEDWYFYSHRYLLARQALEAGFDIYVATRISDMQDQLEKNGFKVIPLKIERGSLNPLKDVALLYQLYKIYKSVKPDVVHHVAIKPVIYGSFIASLLRVPKIINAFGGLGYVYSSGSFRAKILSPFIQLLVALLHRNRRSIVIVQNRDDFSWIRNQCAVPDAQIRLIRGSGVDHQKCTPLPEPEGAFTVAMVARMLVDKGVREYIQAAKIAKLQIPDIRFLLVGDIDTENPASLTRDELLNGSEGGTVEWLGHVQDIEEVWRQAHLAVLPSYREGLPKTLLESSAFGRAAVATDVPGCREIVIDGETGLLVNAKDAQGLAEAILKLAKDAGLRLQMAKNARDKFMQEFTADIVNQKIIDEY